VATLNEGRFGLLIVWGESLMPEQSIAAALSENLGGLRAHEMLIGVSPQARHDALVAEYLRAGPARGLSPQAALIADLRAALARGARETAADLFLALRRLPYSARGVAPAGCRRRALGRRRRVFRRR
jgi:hypothetical protein